jgi:hypothetical protein
MAKIRNNADICKSGIFINVSEKEHILRVNLICESTRIQGLNLHDGEEGPYGDKYVSGQIRIVGNNVEILDWNSNYKTKGGTQKSLALLKKAYGGEIRAVDAGYEGETSFQYWMHMMSKGLVDGIYDDDANLHTA